MPPVAVPLPAAAAPTDRDARDHAIKNCAAVILGVALTMDRHVDEVGRQRIAQLIDASRRMAKLLAPGFEGRELRSETVRVEDVLRQAVNRLGPIAESRSVQLAVDCGGGHVVGDGPELAEALFNLASNALQASPPNTTVRVTTRESHTGDHEWIVEDAGCGIPPNLLCRLGTPGVTTRTEGSGFGLALAVQAISRHHGTLHVESTGVEGRGTTVTVWLPAALER